MINDTIVAPSTPPGVSALAVIRLSGEQAIAITNKVFQGKDLTSVPSHTLHFGKIQSEDRMVDEVLVSVFKGPNSFTKENSIEISTHGSPYIVKEVIKTLIDAGARMAEPGEFTRRAFLNGRFDLAQAEAVADLIHSDSEASHDFAIQQLKGGISQDIAELRERLVHLSSMLELELDFGEEDVEFADRNDLRELIHNIQRVIQPLTESFDLGNAVKNGVPVVIAGKPNAGKSTLLNALLNEEKAIVSDIPGTTRDVIEDQITIDGIVFRFIDTAGLRDTDDTIESIGVARAREQMERASLVLYMVDISEDSVEEFKKNLTQVKSDKIPVLSLGNKVDKASSQQTGSFKEEVDILLSASDKSELDKLKTKLLEAVHLEKIKAGDTIVTNVRHYENLMKAGESCERVLTGLDQGLTGDLLAEDVRMALQSLGEITGEVTNDEILGNIFSKFCIGK